MLNEQQTARDRMRLGRLAQRLSQAELADLTGMDRTRVGRIENGVVRVPMLHEAIALRDVLGIAVDEWIDVEPPVTPSPEPALAAAEG